MEALMRWRHEGRLVPPGEFIPLAEETNLIMPMSEWLVRAAAAQARRWHERLGLDRPISINLPARMFLRSDLVEQIHDAVTQNGVPHGALRLEITEHSLMQDIQGVIPTLHRLNEIGVELSIDDFGTGYSSLAYLTTLPIAELKIDRTFVRDLGITAQSAAIVQLVVALGKTLGMRVVAEGVEHLRQQEALLRLGCPVMQGYLYCRPIPPDELEARFQRGELSAAGPHSAGAVTALPLQQAR
jgi:EAL domain-containing protein (putative c-di-GMP-specific phosphodiesterase class I)